MHYGHHILPIEGQDSGEQLWSTALNKFKQLASKTDFIILLGDIPDHAAITVTQKNAFETKVFHDLFEANKSNKPLFYVTGNNDSLLGNYLAFSSKGVSPLNNAPEWEGGACVHCEGLIIDDSQMREKGYYSSFVMQGNKDIVLIALNANQFAQLPWWVRHYKHQDSDAMQQLDWLEKQLQQIQTKQLLIAMHEEPGLDYKNKSVWHAKYLSRFIQLLNKAQQSNQEVSLIAAHSHYDEIRKITLANGLPIFSYSVPSISRKHYNNSAMKIFSLSPDYYLQNFTTYYTTQDKQWNNDSYSAIDATDNSIFPQCVGKNLAACLSGLSNQVVCNLLKSKLIYGVKNPLVRMNHCLTNYVVN